MASRAEEIQQQFERAYALAIQNQEPETDVLPRKVRMQSSLTTYLAQRDRAMESALRMLSDTDSSATEASQRERWVREIQDAAQASIRLITDLDDNEESILNVTVLGIATIEGNFFAKLSSMPLAGTQGFLLEASRRLDEEREKLEGCWSALSGSAERTNERARQAGKQMLEAFESALSEVGRQKRQLAEAVSAGWDLFVAATSAASGGEPSSQDVFDVPKRRLDQLVSNAEDVARIYRDAYRSEETSIVVIGSTRTSVREFLETTSIEVGRQRTDQARKTSLEIARSALTPGQQADLERVAEDGGSRIQGAMDEYEDSFNAFIDEFRDIFVGPIGTRTLDQLLSGDYWRSTEVKIEGLNVESVLKKYYDEAEEMWDIPLEGLDETLTEAFKDEFKKDLRTFDEVVSKSILTYTSAFRTLFVDYPIRKLEELAGRSKGYDS